MSGRLVAWWHHRRYNRCIGCDREFRKGHGGGPTRDSFCSSGCWANAWLEWMRKPLKPVTWPVES